MELTAVYECLKYISKTFDSGKNMEFIIKTDSSYVANPFSKGWIESWKNNGWVNSEGNEVANMGLWKKIINYETLFSPEFIRIKRCSSPYNIEADKLARKAAKEIKKETTNLSFRI